MITDAGRNPGGKIHFIARSTERLPDYCWKGAVYQ